MPITSESLRALVAEIPEPRLREMFIELVLGNTAVTNPTPAEPPVRRSRGRPKGQPNKDRANGGTTAIDPKLAARRKRYEANRRAKRAAARVKPPAGIPFTWGSS